MDNNRHDFVRTTLAVFFIAGLIAASFWILRPFMPALIWGAMIVVATWPLMLRVQERLWRRRWLAVTVMTSVLLLIFIIPLSYALGTIVTNADKIAGWTQSLGDVRLPAPPDWLQKLPLVGHKVESTWRELAAEAPEELRQTLMPYARDVARWFVSEAGNLGMMAVHFLLTVVMSAILYAHGEAAVAGVRRFSRRLGGAHGEEMVQLAGQAIRAVALGVVVSAIIEATLGGIGLAVAGVPFAAILTALIFIFAVAQIGPGPVLLGAIAWLYWKGDSGWATALLVWSLLIIVIDNVLRPILIKAGADLPLLLIFAGVIGGLVAFGLVGIFVGPMVLAVSYRLLEAWVREAGE